MIGPFAPNSRYYGLPVRTRKLADGAVESFVARRIIPPLARFRAAHRYRVVAADRIDRIAAETLGDAELSWRICDANGDAYPAESTQAVGRLLLIPMPLEVPDDGRS